MAWFSGVCVVGCGTAWFGMSVASDGYAPVGVLSALCLSVWDCSSSVGLPGRYGPRQVGSLLGELPWHPAEDVGTQGGCPAPYNTDDAPIAMT